MAWGLPAGSASFSSYSIHPSAATDCDRGTGHTNQNAPTRPHTAQPKALTVAARPCFALDSHREGRRPRRTGAKAAGEGGGERRRDQAERRHGGLARHSGPRRRRRPLSGWLFACMAMTGSRAVVQTWIGRPASWNARGVLYDVELHVIFCEHTHPPQNKQMASERRRF